MASTFQKLFQPALLSTSAASPIFTVPTTPTTSLLRNGRVQVTNFSTTAAAVTLYAVPVSGSPTTTNVFINAISIAPNGSIAFDVPQLGAGDTLNGLSGTASAMNIQAVDGIIQS